MRRLVITIITLLGWCGTLSAEDVVCDTFHYATNDGIELLLDRYAAGDSTEPRPCMIFAFGGGFVRGERNTPYYVNYFESLAREGIVVVSIDYRLGLKGFDGKGGVRAIEATLARAVGIAVEDIYAATNYVIDNAAAWGVDTQKIMLSGSSAGAIASVQAEWLRCNGADAATVLPTDFRYAAVVSCAGAIFSTKGKPTFNDTPAPMLLFHGTSDNNVPYNKAAIMGTGFYGSKYIAKQLDRIDAPYMFYSVEYGDHQLAGTPLWDKCDLIKQFIRDYVTDGHRQRTTINVENIGTERRKTRFTPMDYIRANYKRK
ncbi:MAG: carboxylesterase family protein [Alistipes sp.]|nr:carboxylesterase family protein [Alistipes sp.]